MSRKHKGCQVIAVYGTLKRGYGNYTHYIKPLIEKGKAEFVGHGIVRGYLLGGSYIPFAKRTGNPGDYIEVEVYRICDEDGMRAIDRLEGAYRKVKVKVKMRGEKVIDAFLYDGSHLTDDARFHNYEELLNSRGRKLYPFVR